MRWQPGAVDDGLDQGLGDVLGAADGLEGEREAGQRVQVVVAPAQLALVDGAEGRGGGGDEQHGDDVG